MNFDNITIVLGILGAYFAVLLVMAVSVETILEPFTALPWLRKNQNPDDILNDVKEWLPAGSGFVAKAVVLQNLTSDVKNKEKQLLKIVEDVKTILEQTSMALDPDNKLIQKQRKIALMFAALRRQYDIDEHNRIIILRIISAALGVLLAIVLKVNTFEILGTLFPPDVQKALTQDGAQIGGMVITGLAASAGSSFWHDMLGRVRNLKDTVQSTKEK